MKLRIEFVNNNDPASFESRTKMAEQSNELLGSPGFQVL